MQVTERYIHSFDVEPAELSHAKVGVCRRCWAVFPDRDAFVDHLLTECDKVSRGKREKWQILHGSFTPLSVDDTSPGQQHTSQLSGAATNSSLPNAQTNTKAHGAGAASVDDDDSPDPPPSPTTIDIDRRVPMDLERDEELERLRMLLRHYKAFVHVIQQHMDLSCLSPVPALVQQAIESAIEIGSDPDLNLPGRLTQPSHVTPEDNALERGDLVGHMNSQPTVHPQGMMDELQQSLSRTSSGMSSDERSTIRHVSNSPPQRFDEYTGSNESTPHPRKLGRGAGPQPDCHQPTSLPDSGYGSDKKRNSIAGLGPPGLTSQAYGQPDDAASLVPQDRVEISGPSLPPTPNGGEEHSKVLEHPVDSQLDRMSPSVDMPSDSGRTQGETGEYLFSEELLDAFGGYSQPSST